MMETATLNIPMNSVQSSQIASIGHHPGSNTLRVKFHGSGATYDYENFPAEKFAEFTKAESKGKFFGSHVKGKHGYRKLPMAKP